LGLARHPQLSTVASVQLSKDHWSWSCAGRHRPIRTLAGVWSLSSQPRLRGLGGIGLMPPLRIATLEPTDRHTQARPTLGNTKCTAAGSEGSKRELSEPTRKSVPTLPLVTEEGLDMQPKSGGPDMTPRGGMAWVLVSAGESPLKLRTACSPPGGSTALGDFPAAPGWRDRACGEPIHATCRSHWPRGSPLGRTMGSGVELASTHS